MSLRTRLVLAAAYLLTVVVVALEIPLARNVDQRAVSEFESSVLGNAAIVAAQVSDETAAVQSAPNGAPAQLARLTRIVDESAQTVGARVVVVDRNGVLLADSEREASVGTQFVTTARPEFAPTLRDGVITTTERFSESANEELLLVTVPISDNEQVAGAVRVSESLSDVRARVRRSWLGLGLIGLAVILAGLALAWFLAGTLARPVRRLEDAAGKLGQGDLDARAHPEGPREVKALAEAFNRMANQLSANIAAQRDFVANASHQLRTPLTGLRLRLEAIEHQGGTGAEQAQKMQRELDRLAELIDDLLQLARAASVETPGERIDLAVVASDAADRWMGPAEDAGKRLEVTTKDGSFVWADPSDLGHVLDNLIENAIKYTPEGAQITVEASSSNGRSRLAVHDNGPGISPQDRERVFERFYRGSTGRQAGAGSGLGLAIVAELVRRWGGDVRLTDGQGTRIEATFPRSLTSS